MGISVQAYPCLCAYYGIYKLGRFSFYLLVPRHTSAYSLLANAMLMCRFAPPLAFNFMAGVALPPSKSYSPGRDVTETVRSACPMFPQACSVLLHVRIMSLWCAQAFGMLVDYLQADATYCGAPIP